MQIYIAPPHNGVQYNNSSPRTYIGGDTKGVIRLSKKVYWVKMPNDSGEHCQKKIRPFIVINDRSGVVTGVCMTSKCKRIDLPHNVEMVGEYKRLVRGVILCNQITTVGRDRLIGFIEELAPSDECAMLDAISSYLGL